MVFIYFCHCVLLLIINRTFWNSSRISLLCLLSATANLRTLHQVQTHPNLRQHPRYLVIIRRLQNRSNVTKQTEIFPRKVHLQRKTQAGFGNLDQKQLWIGFIVLWKYSIATALVFHSKMGKKRKIGNANHYMMINSILNMIKQSTGMVTLCSQPKSQCLF